MSGCEDYRILTGEVSVDVLRPEDVDEIVRYGWDRSDLERMLEDRDYNSIAGLAAWIRESGYGDHGMYAEDDFAEAF